MMDFTGMPFPTTIPMLPGWLIKLLKAMFTHPKKKETPQDVAERQRWRREFTDYVQKQAEAMEQQAAAQLRAYAEQLLTLSQNELARYHISAVPFVQQVELLSMQIPGTIASEVSRRMTDSDAVYQKLCRMLPGAEKEEQSQQQFERTRQELAALAKAAGDGQQQEKLKAQAELLCAACDLTEELFDREEG